MIPTVLKIVSLMLLFAVLNRVRGGGLDWIWKHISAVSKPITGAIIGALVYQHCPEWWVVLPCIGLYWGGESLGWGKWIATILDGQPRYEEDEGTSDGIHYLANKIMPEKVNYKMYSQMAIVIRGIYWWLPLFIFTAAIGATNWLDTLWAFALGGGFLLSLLVAKSVGFYIPRIMSVNCSYSDKDWEEAEIIYGAIQGLALGVVLL